MAILPSGVSWPGWHWWLTLTASDQAAWASGLGTMGAVFAAIWIARGEVRQRHRTAHALERIVAANFYVPLREVLVACRWVIQALERSEDIDGVTIYHQLATIEERLVWAKRHTDGVLEGVTPSDAKHLPPQIGELVGMALMEWRVLMNSLNATVTLVRGDKDNEAVDIDARRSVLRELADWLPLARDIEGRLQKFGIWTVKRLEGTELPQY